MRRALIIGIDTYENPGVQKLQFARKDAQRIADALHALDGTTDRFDTIEFLEDVDDTKALEALTKSIAGLAKGDLFFFYFAGHGAQQTGTNNYLLLCNNAAMEVLKAAGTSNGCIPHGFLSNKVRDGEFDCVLVFDACRSELFHRDTATRSPAPNPRKMAGSSLIEKIADDEAEPPEGQMRDAAGLRRGRRTTACVKFWSCNDGESAEESEELKGGLFTSAFVAEFQARLRERRAITLDESFKDAVVTRIRLSRKEIRQSPAYSKSGDQSVCLYSGGELAPPLPTSPPGATADNLAKADNKTRSPDAAQPHAPRPTPQTNEPIPPPRARPVLIALNLALLLWLTLELLGLSPTRYLFPGFALWF